MQKYRKLAITAVVVLSLAACQHTGENQQFGSLLGAIIGGVAGAQVGDGDGQLIAVGVGSLLGAMIGGEIGRSLDEVDRQLMAQTTEHALNEVPGNTITTWRNPDSGHGGSITPLNTTEVQPGIYCREFQQTVTIGGKTEEAYGKACRQPDGSWEIQPAGA